MLDRHIKILNAYAKSKKDKLVLFWAHCRYNILVQLFRLTTFPSRLRANLSAHIKVYGSVLFVVASTIIIGIVMHLATGAASKTVSDFLNASAAMIGSMLAIVFTFNTLIINFAVDQYPPEFYRLSGYNRRLDVIYSVLASLTLGQFSLGVVFNDANRTNRNVVILLGLVFMFLAVYMLYAAFSIVRSKMNPVSGLTQICNFAIRDLNNAARYIKRNTAVLGSNPDLAPDERQFLPHAAYINLQRSYEELGAYLRYLFGYHTKLIEKTDHEMALQVIDVIAAIIIKYTEVNKQCIPPVPNPGLLTGATTLAEKFFSSNYERMAERTLLYIRQDNELGITKMAAKYTEIGRKLAELEFPLLGNENPEFSRCLGYLSMLMDEIASVGNITAIFRFTEVFAHFGEVAIAHQWHIDITVVHQNLEKAAKIAALKKSDVLHARVATAYFLMAAKHIDHISHERLISAFFESLNTVTRYFLASSNNAAFRRASEFAQPYTLFANKVLQEIANASNPVNQNRDDVQSRMIMFIRQINDALSTLCRSTSLIDRSVVLDYANLLEALGVQLLPNLNEQNWRSNEDRLRSQIKTLAYLYGWFTHDTKQIELHYVDTIVDSAGRIALIAIQQGENEVAIAAASSINVITRALLIKVDTSVLFEAPRRMLTVAILIVACLATGNNTLAAEYRKIVQDFDDLYTAKMKAAGLQALPHDVRAGQPYMGQVFFEFKESMRKLSSVPFDRPDPGVEELVRQMGGVTPEQYAAAFKYLRRK